jgi:hypothetical protein
LSANEESADIVADKKYSQGEFLDGAALAAQELGRKDLPKYLETAWRKAPGMLRLRRWLGSSKNKGVLKKRAAACVAVDKSPEISEWIAEIRSKYRRFSALQQEFDRYLA